MSVKNHCEVAATILSLMSNLDENPRLKSTALLVPGKDGAYYFVRVDKGLSNQRNLNTALHQQELLDNPPFDTLDAPLRERVLDLDAMPQTPEVLRMKEQIALGRQSAILSKEPSTLSEEQQLIRIGHDPLVKGTCDWHQGPGRGKPIHAQLDSCINFILLKESLDLARRYAGKQVSCGAGHKLDAVWLANLIATKLDQPRFYLSCGCTLSRETIERKLGEL
jgi:hypothetical protein